MLIPKTTQLALRTECKHYAKPVKRWELVGKDLEAYYCAIRDINTVKLNHHGK